MHRKGFLGGAAALAAGGRRGRLSARQLASRPVDDWIARLERPDRVAGLKIDYIISSLGLEAGRRRRGHRRRPGRAEPAAGEGGRAGGKVYAVEIDQGFLDRINDKAQRRGA